MLFDFRKLNHTLTESTFENPCKRKASAQAGDGYAAAAALIDTDFQNANPTDTPLLKATTVTFDSAAHAPRYFYCRQGNSTPKSHCGAGMVFAVNVDEDRFRAFQARARATLPKPA